MARETTTGTTKRVSIPLTDAGLVDWDHVRESTAQTLLNIAQNDPEMAKFIGGEKDEDGPNLAEGLTQQNVSSFIDLVQSANALVFRIAAAKFIKNPILRDANNKPLPLVLDPDLLTRTFSFTPEQHAELDPRATRLAQKYSSKMPSWLKENLDLYMFASMFLTYTAQNAKACIEMQVKRDLGRAREAFAQAQVNIPKNPKPDTDAQPVNGHDRDGLRDSTIHYTINEPTPPDAPTV